MRPNDEVWVLRGVNVPVVPRREDGERYELVWRGCLAVLRFVEAGGLGKRWVCEH